MQNNKIYKAIISGRMYKYDEHLQTEIEINSFYHEGDCPIHEHYSSTKMFLYSVLKEAKVNVDTLFMVKISAEMVNNGVRDELKYRLDEVYTMDWEYED